MAEEKKTETTTETATQKLVRKLTSRKFLIAAIAAIAGIITLIVGDNAVVQTIAGAAMTIVPTVIYCIMEGVIDAKSIKTVADATAEAAQKLGADGVAQIAETAGDLAGSLVSDDANSEAAEENDEQKKEDEHNE